MTTTAVPVPYRIVARWEETPDTATLRIEPVGEPLPPFVPGQFAMVWVFGRGEIPLSVSAIPTTGGLAHTVRGVGAVSEELYAAEVGRAIGLRGPYGTGWELAEAAGQDLVVLAGGIGLAPLRPLVRDAVADPEPYGRLNVLVGARTPAGLMAKVETGQWSTAYTGVTVDRPDARWTGQIGVVTKLLDRARFDPHHATAFVCGPEPMIRAAARSLVQRGLAPGSVRVSLDRTMHCATGHCGHCRLGPLLLCRAGPVVGWDLVEPPLRAREL
ncbi:FAD/NAD(P)-binding protein [Streptomyces sp. NPDC021093]|uniref:FAD/NAD(P)-binding protein n=1 Tax=Streptomyces sp. NPDC021093 TaxID=3365112 RepID=UPI0037A7D13C